VKHNLKNRPQIFRLEGRYVTDLKKMKEWFEGFEAELRKELEENQRFANLETSPEVNRVYHSAKVVLLKAILGEEDPK